jgi:hypothetical protein
MDAVHLLCSLLWLEWKSKLHSQLCSDVQMCTFFLWLERGWGNNGRLWWRQPIPQNWQQNKSVALSRSACIYGRPTKLRSSAWMHGLGRSVVSRPLSRHCGINYVGNEVTIRRWHIYFRKNETFPNPLGRSRKLLEPKVFNFFPEMKSKIHEFCAHPNNQL